MKPLALALLLALPMVGLGCAGTDEPRVYTLDPTLASPPERRPDVENPFGQLDRFETTARSPGTKYFSQANAERCPAIEVTTAHDKRVTLTPGTSEFVKPNYVTLLVFFSVDDSRSRAALAHVNDLTLKYRKHFVEAVGIVQQTRSAGSAESVASKAGINFPLYYDDLSQTALREMADEAAAEQETAVPAIFIIDRRMRLRFYRPGFLFLLGPFDPERPGVNVLLENAPDGEHVGDYLLTILREG